MIQSFNKKTALLLIAVPTLFGAVIATIMILNRPKTIKVGILHSITGNMASSEQPVINGILTAIEEINNNGGLLNKQIEPIIADGASNPKIFASAAQNLIEKKQVTVIFGCWASSTRKEVKPIVEKNNNLLFYGASSEGLEVSPNIIYTGLTPNQQIIPGIIWAKSNFGPNMYLIGSSYILQHATHEIIKQFAKNNDINILGETFLPRASANVEKAIQEIKNLKPNIIINTIKGSSNTHFFKKLYEATINGEPITTLSTCIGENTAYEIGPKYLSGHHFLTSSDVKSIKSDVNKRFLELIKKKYGNDNKISNETQTAYTNVYIWADAVKNTKTTTDIKKIKQYLGSNSLMSPQGPIVIDKDNFYRWQTPLILKFLSDGEALVIWQSQDPIKPEAYPHFLSKKHWDDFLLKKYNEWGHRWGKVGL